jgi:hypothetical protein
LDVLHGDIRVQRVPNDREKASTQFLCQLDGTLISGWFLLHLIGSSLRQHINNVNGDGVRPPSFSSV